MSEYQYYEFRALDKPLSASQQQQVSALSSRAQVSSRSAVFVYNYSNFRGDEIELVSKSFDIMLYLANWGSRRLLLRLPLDLIDVKRVAGFCSVGSIGLRHSADGKSLLLDFSFESEDGGWLDGEGWLDPLLPLREMLLRGDYRPLYLAWLKAAQSAWDAEEIDEDTHEPMLPAGLKSTDRALEAWIEFLDLDQDLLAVAAAASSKSEVSDLKPLIERLPKAEQLAFLARLSDDEPLLSVSLNRRLQQLAGAAPKSLEPRSFGDILEAAEVLQAERLAKQERKAAKALAQHLQDLAAQEPVLWGSVSRLFEEKKPKSYDEALKHLKSLKQLAEHQHKLADFKRKIQGFRAQYSNRPALLSRLDQLKL